MTLLVRNDVTFELENLLISRTLSPFIFRTRLERVLYKLANDQELSKNELIINCCTAIKLKIKCLSDQSNQTLDGTLNTYLILENDLKGLISELT